MVPLGMQRGVVPQRKGMKEHQGLHGRQEEGGAQRVRRHRGATAASPAAVLMGMRFHCERCHWEEAGPQAQGSSVTPPGLAPLLPLCPPAGGCLGHG